MASSQLDLQKQLTECFEEGYKLRNETARLEATIIRLNEELGAAQREMDNVSLRLQGVESRKEDIFAAVCNGTGAGSSRSNAAAPYHASATPIGAVESTNGSALKSAPGAGTSQPTSQKVARMAGKRGAPDMLCEAYTTVVLLDKKWTEIWCQECGANTAAISGKFFTGIGGLVAHLCKSHPRPGGKVNIKQAPERCGRRVLSREDVSLIRQRKEPLVNISKRTGISLSGGASQGVEHSAADDDYSENEDEDDLGTSAQGRTLQSSSGKGMSEVIEPDDSDNENEGHPLEGWTRTGADADCDDSEPSDNDQKRKEAGVDSDLVEHVGKKRCVILKDEEAYDEQGEGSESIKYEDGRA